MLWGAMLVIPGLIAMVKLAFQIESAGGTVRLVFNKPTPWIGFGATDARQLAAMLLKHADNAEN